MTPQQYTRKIRTQLAKQPDAVRLGLEAACGDLTRLPVKAGQFTVHNRSQVEAPPPPPPKLVSGVNRSALAALFDYDDATPVVAAPPVAPPRPVPRPRPKKKTTPPPAPKPQPRTRVALEDLAALVNQGEVKVTAPAPGVTVVKAPPRPAPVDYRVSPMPAAEVIRNFNWDAVDLDATAIKLRDLMKDGVPEAIRYTYKDDVLAVFGLTTELMEGALRHPERVEIRPESFNKDKRYPCWASTGATCRSSSACASPSRPRSSAYATGRLEHDHHRVNSTGGGGKRSSRGLPGTPRRSSPSCGHAAPRVELNPLSEGRPVEVFTAAEVPLSREPTNSSHSGSVDLMNVDQLGSRALRAASAKSACRDGTSQHERVGRVGAWRRNGNQHRNGEHSWHSH
jgi:hypothetical protein